MGAQALDAKEDVHSNVREEYDDILKNLRGDLDESRKIYKSLQEENFSLKNQLDVFTNVNAKRMQLDRTPSPLASPTTPTSPTSKKLVQETESQSVEQKDASVLKSNYTKIKSLCKKYKAELLTVKGELDVKNK